ncbi:MAG TPA: ribulose bisphosphate carboxylase small subunit [Calditrichae bacterium]|nr:ribulose bisphosphate carboxylase small subunit [Calditrichia bacterium]
MKLETFSYLPQMSDADIKKQIEYIVKNGWYPGIEYTETPGPENAYWTFWKLPFFNAETPEEVLEEIQECQRNNPNAYIKLTGYDNKRQCQVFSFVVYKPQAAA